MDSASSPIKHFALSAHTLSIIYINVVLYALCYHLQRPVEPFLIEKLQLGKNSNAMADYAKLQSAISIVQTVGSIIVGRLLDRYGSKAGFIVNFLASAASYAILVNSKSLFDIYISKIPTIFQAGFLCSQVAVAQATADGPERVLGLNRLTLAYLIGTTLGPSVGGWLGSSGDYFIGAKFAVIGSLLSAFLACFLPRSNAVIVHNDEKKNDEPDISNTEKFEPKPESLFEIIKSVWSILLTKTVSGIANSMRETVFPLILKNIYSLNEAGLGLSMSILSICNGLSTIFLIGPIVSWANDRLLTVVTLCLSGMTLVLILMSGIETPIVTLLITSVDHRYYLFMSTIVIISILQYILATILTGESTSRVGARSKGMLLGLEHALYALARIGSPQLGVYLLQQGGLLSVGGACASLLALTSLPWLFSPASTVTERPSERKEK